MIVTRSWLEEFIDLSSVDNEKLYETFNSIGLEVDSVRKYSVAQKVVAGKILNCKKHPNADKLNVCEVDIGDGIKQIVCGASNVVDAEYVAVATVGAVLPGGLEIKRAELRGIESEGMICSSSELGLPDIGDGIMILDDSIGELKAGRELSAYPKIADTVFELELTANRGDCLSIHGVARDLSAALDIDMESFSYKPRQYIRRAIARTLSIHAKGETSVDLNYALVEMEKMIDSLLIDMRLGFAGISKETVLDKVLAYSTHATGVVLRVYDMEKMKEYISEERISLHVSRIEHGVAEVCVGETHISTVGINQYDSCRVTDSTKEILVEASYIEPESVVAYASETKAKTDELYYRTSRGSEPDLRFGICYMAKVCDNSAECLFSDTPLAIEREQKSCVLSVDTKAINEVIGMEIPKKRVHEILKRLGFDIQKSTSSDVFGATVPEWRHDISNAQDISEEIMRMIGINNIPSKAMQIPEKNRITKSALLYKAKRDIRLRAAAAGFFEAVTYVFSDKKMLEDFGFDTVSDSYDLKNPIVDELNTLRSTLLVNLLESVRRNISYGKKRIPLFETGLVFDKARNEIEKIAFVWCGEQEEPGISNHGKPPKVDFAFFIERLASVIGDFKLEACGQKNAMMHPYLSARMIIDNREAGYVSKLHPEAAALFDAEDAFIAELDLQSVLPVHRNASPVSNFQGVYKDLSLLLDDSVTYEAVRKSLQQIEDPVIRDFFPVDIYYDEQFAGKKSLTIRFYLQSEDRTLSEEDIDRAIGSILGRAKEDFGAELR